MIHPHTELRFINDKVGYGVVATEYIPKGTITWVMDKLDRSFSDSSIKRLGPAYATIMSKYTFRDNKGRWILCWDISRYVNHSFQPNCITTAYDFELSVRDILPGEQITNHYGYLNLLPMELFSDDGSTKALVSAEDVLRHAEEWDRQLLQAFTVSDSVEQPLYDFLTSKMKRKIRSVCKKALSMDSIKTCYFAGTLRLQ